MSDIVERLRDQRSDGHLNVAAAAEIERLRALHTGVRMSDVERLIEERDHWQMRAEEAEELLAELRAKGSDELNREAIAATRVWFREAFRRRPA